MDYEYIVVQAGGKGTRMEWVTKNKPKALVPIKNLPMIFHLFKKYPDKKFIIIGDYKIDVLKKYLSAFAKVKYVVIDAKGKKGTCAGISTAINIIPNGKPFIIIWSDLILAEEFKLPDNREKNYLGISKDFVCRWSYIDECFVEIPSKEEGVAGFFILKDKNVIKNVPMEGEFVKWLKTQNISFDPLALYRTREYGLIDEYTKLKKEKCRPFNKLTIKDNILVKEGIDKQGKDLAVREKKWYNEVIKLGFKNIPKIYEFEPLTMELINGKNIYECDLSIDQKKYILKNLVSCLKKLHNLGETESDYFSIYNNYISKTIDRINKIRDLVPFANKEFIKINGRVCRNVFFYMDEFKRKIDDYNCRNFKFIHGDCTFSNLMLKKDNEPVLIDPRGYFGFNEIYGDEAYDWAKLYYSIKGNYDQFNLKNFRLTVNENDVELQIKSNNWEELEDYFFELIGSSVEKEKIKLIHAIIWLSLTTYAWEDYDSICGAFYNGLYYLEEVL
ncbi:NTP transferase domain-containing protein [Clostridium felsineum]|uniref:sugar phosphate nucleotidyltransferase n=1 Tax=Clostridium felsineum TaxID=36839 RepID=UPI00358DB5CD|nr:NTP transferase domain-containing protein [Clostridium felsineum]